MVYIARPEDMDKYEELAAMMLGERPKPSKPPVRLTDESDKKTPEMEDRP